MKCLINCSLYYIFEVGFGVGIDLYYIEFDDFVFWINLEMGFSSVFLIVVIMVID